MDTCPGAESAVVGSGDGYTGKGELYEHVHTARRNSRFAFLIYDTAGDGLCCNAGEQGYYKVLADDVPQAEGGEFTGLSDERVFGLEECPDQTSKPTNVVSFLRGVSAAPCL